MKVLVATDLLASMLLHKDYVDGMDILFMWFRKLRIACYMDISSLMVLTHFTGAEQLQMLHDFRLIKEIPPTTDNIQILKKTYVNKDVGLNNIGEKTLLPNLSWLDSGYVDFIITENAALFELARRINLDNRVYGIENFIEKCTIEHRDVDPTKGVIVKEVKLGSLSLHDVFFASFIKDYSPYYYQWFSEKSNDKVYVSKDTHGNIKAILKLKTENEYEDYSNIIPVFSPARRLKISSFKVDYTGQRIGERFMLIIFQCALKENVREIYVTIFNNSQQKKRLVNLLSDFGFSYYGVKEKNEEIYVKRMLPSIVLSERENFPFVKYHHSAFLIPIHHEYSKDLLPKVDLYFDKNDIEPYKCSIKKVITLYANDPRIQKGSVLLFYNMTREIKERGIIAIGVVESVYRNIKSENQYVLRCRKRSVLDDERLKKCWQRKDSQKDLVIVEFLYNYSFGDTFIPEIRVSQCGLDLSTIRHQTPLYLTKRQYKQIIKGTDYEKNIDFD